MAAILPIASDNGPRGRTPKSSATGATRESGSSPRAGWMLAKTIGARLAPLME
ncbi:hypothetical protein GCM10023335_56200 [Streptomyces siamensis]|uniref:Uncharacterized protein n=1 Tax=Streptomyces siamensis TaxID=1274986 RepID=A0ABP9J7T8_9ACTN